MEKMQDAIIRAMDERRLSQAELSRRSGVSKSSLSRYLGGDDMPASKLGAIARALNMSVDELLGVGDAQKFPNDEMELIGLFRSMNAHGKEQLMVFARGCAASYPKNKADSLGA